MAQKGPGRVHRKGLTVIQLLDMFPDDASSERWLEEQRWPEGRFCPDCGSINTAVCKGRKPMPYRCRDCRKLAAGTGALTISAYSLALLGTVNGIDGVAAGAQVLLDPPLGEPPEASSPAIRTPMVRNFLASAASAWGVVGL